MRNFNYATATKVGRPDVSAISKDEDHISFKFRRSVPKLPERNYISSKENVKGKPSASTLTSKCPAAVSQSTIHTTQGPEVRLTASATEVSDNATSHQKVNYNQRDPPLDNIQAMLDRHLVAVEDRMKRHSEDINTKLLQITAVKKEDLPVLKGYYYPHFYSLQDGKVRTATYVKDSLQTAPIRVPVRELSTACEVIMQNGSRLSLVNIYYPESCNHADLAWLQNLDAAHWVMVGDFNAHHSWWGGDGSITDAAGRQLAEKIMTSDLCLLNDGTHTRVPDRADHGATAIDLTLVSSSLYGEAEWETSSELWGSDHLPISLLLRGVQLREDSVARVTYNYSNADWNGFQHLLASAVYPSPTDNIEIWYEDLRDVILQAAEGMIPKKDVLFECKSAQSSQIKSLWTWACHRALWWRL
ncbi:hypothetical protein ACOMHN_018623 [Nucella lapillus]